MFSTAVFPLKPHAKRLRKNHFSAPSDKSPARPFLREWAGSLHRAQRSVAANTKEIRAGPAVGGADGKTENIDVRFVKGGHGVWAGGRQVSAQNQRPESTTFTHTTFTYTAKDYRLTPPPSSTLVKLRNSVDQSQIQRRDVDNLA